MECCSTSGLNCCKGFDYLTGHVFVEDRGRREDMEAFLLYQVTNGIQGDLHGNEFLGFGRAGDDTAIVVG